MRPARPLLFALAFAVFSFVVLAQSAGTAPAASCTWIGTAGNWNVSGNWSCAAVPGPGDLAVINGPGMVVTLTTDVTVGSLTLGGGSTLGGPGAISVTTAFNWMLSTITSTVSGTPFNLLPGAVMTISENVTLRGRQFNNHGAALWTAGQSFFMYEAAFNNTASGALTISTSTGGSFNTVTTGAVNNAGRIVKSGAANTVLYTDLNNSGAVTLTAGILRLYAGGTHSGSFAVPAGSALEFWGGTNVLQPGASVKGAGSVNTGGGTAVISGTYNVSTTAVNLGGLFLATGEPLVLDQVSVGGGELGLSNGSGTVVNRLSLAGGTLKGSDALTVTGLFTWTGGIITGTLSGTPVTLQPGGIMTIAGTTSLYGRPLNNNGTAFHTTGSPYFTNGAAFNNSANGTLAISAPAGFSWLAGTSGALNNSGRILKTSAVATEFYVSLNNSGAVTLTAGTIRFRADGAHSGSFAVPDGTALDFRNSTNTFDSASSVIGAGSVAAGGGTAVIGGTYNVSKTVVTAGALEFSTGHGLLLPWLTIGGGTLTGSDPLSVTTTFDWSLGTLSSTAGATPFTVLPGATMNITWVVTLNSRVLNNQGTALWTAGTVNLNNSAAFNNAAGGTLTLAATAGEFWFTNSGGTFNNAGTLIRSVAPALPISVPFANTGDVLLTNALLQFNADFVQTAGVTTLSNARIVKGSGAIALLGGQLRGTGVITANLNHQGGVVAPGGSAGVLKLAGNYVQSPGAQLDIEIGGLTSGMEFDLFDVTGSASLGGALNLSLINGFTPSPGDTFRVMNYASHTGAFASVLGSNVGSGMALKPRYYADNVTLEVWRLLFVPLIVR